MKILMITHCMVGRGTYIRAFNLARELVKMGSSVTIIATSLDEKIKSKITEVDGVTIYEAPDLLNKTWRSGWDLWDLFFRLNYVTRGNYDLVHAFESRPTVIYPALYYSTRHDVPLLFDWADWFGAGGSVEERNSYLLKTLLRPAETFFEEHFRKRAPGITVICSTLQKKAIKLGIPVNRIYLLPNGCDTKRFYPINGRNQRIKYEIPLEATTIGYIGAIFSQDARLLCDAFSILEQKVTGVKLISIGNGGKEILNHAKSLDNYIDLGYLPDDQINNCINMCDVIWFPFTDSNSNRGRWPLKFNDAIAAGKPIITTKVGDIAEIVQKEGIGIVTEVCAGALSKKTMELIRDQARINKMGLKARRLAETKFRWDVLATDVSRMYHEVVNS
jgi:glycosyltransferase involved in cell wall biosynthesis